MSLSLAVPHPLSHKNLNISSRFGKQSHEVLGREGEVRQGKEGSSSNVCYIHR